MFKLIFLIFSIQNLSSTKHCRQFLKLFLRILVLIIIYKVEYISSNI